MPRHIHIRQPDLSDREFITHGLPRGWWSDLYHFLMTVGWPQLFASFAGFFLVFNLLFGLVYAVQPGDVANVDPRGYWGLFFFSVETFATVGYGDMHPQTVFAHGIATFENFVGLTSLALITGITFARFSRPRARFLFARYAVVRPIDGRATLMLRSANARQNIVMEAQASLRLIRDESTTEGYAIRRIHDLPLLRSHHPMFLFGWTLMHVIDAASPLHSASPQSLRASRAFLLLTISGTDETTGQTIMSRARYEPDRLRWNHSFADILSTDEHGVDHFDYRRFHDVEPLA